MGWAFTGNIARIGTKYGSLEILGGRARVLTYLREALSSIAYGRQPNELRVDAAGGAKVETGVVCATSD
jgi:hypothetical protein